MVETRAATLARNTNPTRRPVPRGKGEELGPRAAVGRPVIGPRHDRAAHRGAYTHVLLTQSRSWPQHSQLLPLHH